MLTALLAGCADRDEPGGLRVEISLPASAGGDRAQGRLLLFLAPPPEAGEVDAEPRFRISPRLGAIPVYGIDVADWGAGEVRVLDGEVFGFPVRSLDDLEPGDYQVQALLHRYEDIDLPGGPTVRLPWDRGEGQQWRRAPGNLYSTPRTVRIEGGEQSLAITLDQEIPPIEPLPDTRWIRRVRVRSERLSAFWGRDVHLGANVLVPRGFDERTDARYPLILFHGHYSAEFNGFRTRPPDDDLECRDSRRFGVDCYNRIAQQEAYDFYRRWIADDFPRVLIVEIQHPNPYYDDSYAVNSANLGPYGDAIMEELLPEIERRFRGIGEGWARFSYGGSTGGWEALAAQIFYPDEFNGVFAACPDPIDFRAFQTVDLYGDDNVFFYPSRFKVQERPGWRDRTGRVEASMRDYVELERVLGSRGRSGGQFHGWQAVFSPRGDDGYPQPIWNEETGRIDHEVALHWRDHYDLRFILERDWATLGPRLVGKLHIYSGDMDNYYLNNAVRLMQEFLESTTDPHYDGEIVFGDGFEHCWNGDPDLPNHLSRLRYNTRFLPSILERIETTAPAGADLHSWRY